MQNKNKWYCFNAYRVASKGVYELLIAGWVFVIGCMWLQAQVPASGAILICFTIFAEIRVSKYSWQSTLELFSGQLFERDRDSNLGYTAWFQTQDRLIKEGFMAGYDLDGLKRVAKGEMELPTIGLESGKWRAKSTALRVNKIASRWITLSLFFGTLVWAYGEIFFPHSHDELELCKPYVPISRLDACSSWEAGWLHRCEPADLVSPISSCQ